jgi:hypothetical protein
MWIQFGNTTYNGTNGQVNAFALDGSNAQLYVGGTFTTVQDISNTTALTTNYVAKWNIFNKTWTRLLNWPANGTAGMVQALSLDSKNYKLYVGGTFTSVYDNSNTPTVTQYIGSYNCLSNNIINLSSIGSGYTNGVVYSIKKDVSKNAIYVGG